LLQSDLDIAARTVAGEARGEPYDDQVDVAQAMTNRWRSNRGQFQKDHILVQAVTRHAQFSCFNQGDANFPFIMNLDPSDRVYRTALRAVLEAIDSDEDRTLGACHYKAIGTFASWAEGKTPCYTNGGHEFYNDVD